MRNNHNYGDNIISHKIKIVKAVLQKQTKSVKFIIYQFFEAQKNCQKLFFTVHNLK